MMGSDLSPNALVGLPCCLKWLNERNYHVVSDVYVQAVVRGARATPVLVPAVGALQTSVLERLDGLLLTGSPSNIEPHHYDGPAAPQDNMVDPARDATTLPMIRAAIEMGLPLFGICRGMQELNVACGGTLHQELHAVAGRIDHRSEKEGSLDHRYRYVHPVTLTDGGLCASLAGGREVQVNSLHGQGIDRLASGFEVEARALDGTVEAIRMAGPGFVMAVQWHPEWSLDHDPLSMRLLSAFGDACLARSARRGRPGGAS